MKIHNLASPPGGITSLPVTIEEVKVTGQGMAMVRFRTPTGEALTVPIDFGNLAELPFPGTTEAPLTVNVSLWRQT